MLIGAVRKFTPGFVKPENRETSQASEPSDDRSIVDKVIDLGKRAYRGINRPEFPTYKQSEKTYDAAIENFDLRDESRDRDVPLTVYYPKNKEELESSPVVVMSHGLAGNSLTYRYFGQHLAEHGYTVLQPTHVGSDTKSFLLKPSWNIIDDALGIFSQQELVDRGRDVSFALDQLAEGRLGEDVQSKVDLENVALAGHSFGALTTQAMAGVTVKDEEGREVPIQDDRFDAFIAMSPYGDSVPTHLLGMDPESYEEIKKPLLTLSGDKDWLFTGTGGPKVHLDTFYGAGSDRKYHVVIGNTFHASFAQVFGTLGPTKEMTNSTSLAFLDANLKGDEEAQAYLDKDLQRVAASRKSVALVHEGCGHEN